MELSTQQEIFTNTFVPGALDRLRHCKDNGTRFVYYTSADTALKVFSKGEIWLRNAKVMNDWSEIAYGLEKIEAVFSGPEGERFRSSVESIFPGTIQEAEKLLSDWMDDWKLETYLACVSVHDPLEDECGRLSMWRAYGDVAIVIKNTPLVAVTDLLGVYSTPVLYLSANEVEQYVSVVATEILKNAKFIKAQGQEWLISGIHRMAFTIAIGCKHPAFKEEQEWRIFYRPNEQKSDAITMAVEVIAGVPQRVMKLRLGHEPQIGLFGADLPSLVDRVIIGPTQHPYVTYRAFADVLEQSGIKNSASKVIVSDIPLRTSK
jgi:hypothetical protein